MHQIHFVHRDIKSSNILLEFKDSKWNAVLCDFGLARNTDENISTKLIGKELIFGFSPRYAAPEVFVKQRVKVLPDPGEEMKSDVYAFGVIAWELLTREIPWNGLDISTIESKVRSGDRLPMMNPSTLSQEETVLVGLCSSCWVQYYKNRPSIESIHQKLSSFMD